MSAQRLSAKSIRRIERSTPQAIRRAWGHGGYEMGFVTPDHRHGWWDKKTGNWYWDDNPIHYTSCRELFDGGPGVVPPWRNVENRTTRP